MAELALILLGALLVNNFVLAQFLGLCPFMGVTRSFAPALAMSAATAFVLTLTAIACHRWVAAVSASPATRAAPAA